jgi:hypothetical protein
MRLVIAAIILIAIVMLFQGAFRGSRGGPVRAPAYGPSGGAY